MDRIIPATVPPVRDSTQGELVRIERLPLIVSILTLVYGMALQLIGLFNIGENLAVQVIFAPWFLFGFSTVPMCQFLGLPVDGDWIKFPAPISFFILVVIVSIIIYGLMTFMVKKLKK
jgi:hypothetical protein